MSSPDMCSTSNRIVRAVTIAALIRGEPWIMTDATLAMFHDHTRSIPNTNQWLSYFTLYVAW